MKHDFLMFPKEYEVGKQIRDQFINYPFLTAGRRQLLEKHVTEIEILYDLKFLDGSEIIILFVGINKDVNKLIEKYIALAIAASFPYHSMVLVHKDAVAKIYTFEACKQVRNSGKMNIKKVYCTPELYIEEHDKDTEKLLKLLRNCYDYNDSADLVCKRWCNELDFILLQEQSEKDHFVLPPMKRCDDGKYVADMDAIYEMANEEIRWIHSNEFFLDRKAEMADSEYAKEDWWNYDDDIDD